MKLEDFIADYGIDDAVVFGDPDNGGYEYTTAIIGITTDDRVVYDYNKMIEWAMRKWNWSLEDAVDWIDYNTVRALYYYSGNGAPIIIYPIEEEIDE